MLGASNVSFKETYGRFWTGCRRDVVFDLDSRLFYVTTEEIINIADGSVMRFLYEAIFVCY